DPLMCTLSNSCSVKDQDQCVCVGCNGNNWCDPYDDCVCSVCANAQECKGCNNDGSCNPYSEGCGCGDCAAHPLCQ
ncbi:MAG: hypothetical protein KC457_30855, partial [Myxococcales bacterium]|nr:hypothetical protein [Myxococcales bacterium]